MWHIPVALKTLALCLLCTGWTLVATSDLKGDPDLDISYGHQNVVKHLRFPNDIDNNDLTSDPFEELDKYVETLVKHLDVSNKIECLDIKNYFPHLLSELVCNCTDKRILDQLVIHHQHKIRIVRIVFLLSSASYCFHTQMNKQKGDPEEMSESHFSKHNHYVSYPLALHPHHRQKR